MEEAGEEELNLWYKRDTHPIALIPCINLPDGKYSGFWQGSIVIIGSNKYDIQHETRSTIPLPIALNVTKGHGFVWMHES